MDVDRRNVIAYEILKANLRQDGLRLNKNLRRYAGSLAKETGVPFQEMLDFHTDIINDMLREAVGNRQEPTEAEMQQPLHEPPFSGHGGH